MDLLLSCLDRGSHLNQVSPVLATISAAEKLSRISTVEERITYWKHASHRLISRCTHMVPAR
ncbi:hypothetical protein SCHPADRAFT_903346, partial [Schizopora paradoxa]